jgi:HORMA domain-containing protein
VNVAFTATRTNTYTDARLWAVLPEVGADFYALACTGLISLDMANRWTEELGFVLQHQAARGFQIQLTYPNGARVALDYRVSSDGSIKGSSTAGGIDYYALPVGARAVLFVDLDTGARNYPIVEAYTQRRGWGTGSAVQGEVVRDRVYSKDGYGFIRGKIGGWP